MFVQFIGADIRPCPADIICVHGKDQTNVVDRAHKSLDKTPEEDCWASTLSLQDQKDGKFEQGGCKEWYASVCFCNYNEDSSENEPN